MVADPANPPRIAEPNAFQYPRFGILSTAAEMIYGRGAMPNKTTKKSRNLKEWLRLHIEINSENPFCFSSKNKFLWAWRHSRLCLQDITHRHVQPVPPDKDDERSDHQD